MWRHLLLLGLYLSSTAIPLLTGIGRNLEYEYALLCAWAALLLLPLYAIMVPSRYLAGEGKDATFDPAQQVFWVFVISPILALVPPVLMFTLKACPCSRTGFIFWMAYLWYPAWILAHALLHGFLAARSHSVKKSFVSLSHAVIIIVAIAFTSWTLWHEPQKRFLGLFAGFLHGPIYDEFIGMDDGLVLGRLAHFFTAAALLTLAWWQRKSYGLMAATTVLGVLALTCGTFSETYPSMSRTKKELERELSEKMSGSGFTLHFVPNAAAKSPDIKIERLYRDAAFHLSELGKILQGKDPLPHVEIYAYESDQQKKLWFGGGATDVTDVRTPSIHITLDSWPHPTLRHELVHALTSGFGFYGLGFHPNMAFTEGFAVALAPEPRTMTLDDGAASLIESKRLPEIQDLFSPLFWRVSGGRAYTVAGSFIRFLIDTKGVDGVKALYAGADWDKAFGSSRDDLIKSWKERVLSGYDKDRNALYAEALFRSPGLFEEQCPHTKVDYEQDRDDGVYVRVRQPLGWDPAAEYAPWLLSLDPGSTAAKLKLWKRDIKHLGAERFPNVGQLQKWRDLLTQNLNLPPKSLEDIEMALLLSDVMRLQGETTESLKMLTAVQESAIKRHIGDQLVRDTEARLRVEQIGDPQALEWRKVLAGFTRTLPEQNKEPSTLWLLSYLRFRNAKDDQMSKEELNRNLTEVPPDISLPQTFAFEWYKLLAARFMKLEEYTLAAQSFELAASVARPATKELYQEHTRRAQYYASMGRIRKTPPGAGH